MSRRSDTTENQEFPGNISIVPNVNLSYGDGSIEVYGSVFTDTILPNTIGGSVNLQNTLFDDSCITIKNSLQSVNTTINSQKIFVESNKLKSIDNSGLVTIYQPTTTKGDIIVNNGINTVRFPVGISGKVLTANSNTTTGLEWQTITSKRNDMIILNLLQNKQNMIMSLPVSSSILSLSPLLITGSSANFIINKNSANIGANITTLNKNNSTVNSSNFVTSYPNYNGFMLTSNGDDNNGNYKILDSSSFNSINFTLTNTNVYNYDTITTGAFFLSIYNYISGPSETFLICKSNPNSNACAIVKLSSSPGISPFTSLNITWPSNSSISISKSTINYDGLYYITNNFQNTSFQCSIILTNSMSSIIPTNIFPYYTQKSFFVSIIGETIGSPNAIFSVSKNSNLLNGNIFSVCSPGTSSLEKLILTWSANSLININKTGVNYNGNYTVTFTQLM